MSVRSAEQTVDRLWTISSGVLALLELGEVYQDKRIKSNGVCIQEFIKLMHPHDLAKRSSGRVEEPHQSVDG